MSATLAGAEVIVWTGHAALFQPQATLVDRTVSQQAVLGSSNCMPARVWSICCCTLQGTDAAGG